ncbi:MAG: PEP-CTERM system TPR-repeat protein PrsT [Betaproteobacteria bacterium]|nr:PEP-CTERM system TPR-repeat protein PrsT [Betaproteobacteria bacterium]
MIATRSLPMPTRPPFLRLLLASLVCSLMLGACGKVDRRTSEEHIQAAKQAEKSNDFRGVVIEYRNALQKQPGNIEARLQLGRAYLRFNLGQEAETELRLAEKEGADHDTVVVPLGEAMLLRGKYQEVLNEIKASDNSTFDVQAEVMRMRGDALFGLRRTEEACKIYQEALDLDKNLIPALWGLSNCAHVGNDPAGAERTLRGAIQLDPDNADSHIRLGDILRQQGRYKESEEAFSTAVKLAPAHATAYVHRAGARLALNKEKEAGEDVQTAAKIEPASPLVIYMQALLDYRAGRYLPAQEKLLVILKNSPWHFQTVLLYGQVTYKLGYYKSTELHLSRLLEIAPDSSVVRTLIAASQIKQGNTQAAMETLKPGLTIKQADPMLLATAGDVLLGIGQPAKAQEFFAQALASTPSDITLRTALGRSLLAQGKRDKAIEEFRKAGASSPKWTQADATLVMVYIQQGAPDKALAELAAMPESKRASNAMAENLSALAYMGKKENAKAREHLQQALRLRSDFVTGALNLAFLELREKRPAEARAALDRLIEKHPGNLEALLGRAAIEAALGQDKLYEKWLEKAATAAPASPVPQQRLAQHFLRTRNLNKAMLAAKSLQAIAPDDPDTLRLLANIHIASGDDESAVQHLNRVTSLEPQSSNALIDLANVQSTLGKARDARTNYEKAVTLNPAALKARAGLIRIDIQERKFDQALVRARELAGKFPSAPDGHVLAGDVLMWMERYAEAAQAYEAGLKLQKSGPIVISLMKALRGAGKSDQALHALVRWVEQSPDDDSARMHLAAIQREDGNPQDAVKHYEYILKRNPEHGLALNEMALALQKLKDARAQSIAEQAYKVLPTPATADTLAGILLEKGNASKALELLERVITTSRPKPETRLRYARALSATGQKGKAQQEVRKVINGSPTEKLKAEANTLMQTLQ